MSGKKPEPTPPEKPLHESPTKAGRLAKLKKAGWIVFATAISAIVVVSLFALVSSKSGSGLIISVDRRSAESHFTMGLLPRSGTSSSDPSGSGSGGTSNERILIGEPLGKADLVDHKSIRSYYESNFANVENFETGEVHAGSWNYIEQESHLALFYTFYLNNISDDEAQPFGLAARLNSELTQAPEARGRRPYDYVRLGVYLGNYGQPDDTLHIFANENTKRWGTDYNDVKTRDDYRECLGKTGSYDDWNNPIVSESGEQTVLTYRYPQYSSSFKGEEIAFCELFQPGNDGLGLFSIEDTIAPGQSRRITFFAYLEGEDPDSFSDSPINQSLGFTLSVGV